MAYSRLVLAAVALVGAGAFAVSACSTDLADVTGPTEFKCEASQLGPCNFECTEGTCTASCGSPNNPCNLTCKNDSNCSCTGNSCNLTCQTSGTCDCKASICSKR